VELLFIYGPAAAGKLTIAREVAKLTNFRLFHNHLTVDAVMAVFDFGSESFIELREHI
jgi:cytidylate kinase